MFTFQDLKAQKNVEFKRWMRAFTIVEVCIMAIRVVEFSNGGYKIRKVFA